MERYGSVARSDIEEVLMIKWAATLESGAKEMAETDLFKWGHFEKTVILTCVRWYLRYSLSYRDLEEIMRDRGVKVDHTTIYRWVQRRLK